MMLALFSFLWFMVAIHTVGGDKKPCYYNDGTEDQTSYPCDRKARFSACCEEGQECGTSFHCGSNESDFLIRTCTDASWRDNACPIIPPTMLSYGKHWS